MASANLKVNPYFDDFSEDKNFYKILFKPGNAVQARELTQVQSILQNQIGKIGGYLFKDGTSVSGLSAASVSINNEVRSVKLTTSVNGVDINVSNFLDKWVIGTTSEILGEVKYVYEADNPNIGDPPTIVILLSTGKYTTLNSGFFEDGEILKFYTNKVDALARLNTDITAVVSNSVYSYYIGSIVSNSNQIEFSSLVSGIKVGDYITHPSIKKNISVVSINSSILVELSEQVPTQLINERIGFIRRSTCHSSILTVDSGTYYKNETFIKSSTQSIVPSKYTAYPTNSAILRFNESVITSDVDASLLDPAIGSSNFFARGADRLKYELVLEMVELTSFVVGQDRPVLDDTYIEIIRFVKGNKTIFTSRPDATTLRQELAQRTYDESGNYIVNPFNISAIPGSDTSSTLKFNISAGTAYVGGYEISTIAPSEILIDRALTTDTELAYNISVAYGNYLLIDGITRGLLSETVHGAYAVVEAHTVLNPTSSATRVGYLFYKHLEYDSGTGNNSIYRLYNYFFYPDSSNELLIENTKSLITVNSAAVSPNGATYALPLFYAKIATAGLDSNSKLRIFEPQIDNLVFPISRNYIKTVDRITTQYNKSFADKIASNGQIALTVNAPESFGSGDGVLSQSQARSLFTAVAKTVSGATGIGRVPLDTLATITLTNQGKTATIQLTDTTFNGYIDINAVIDCDDTAIRTKTLSGITGTSLTIALADTNYPLNIADINTFYNAVRLTTEQTYGGVYSDTSNYALNDVVIDGTNGNVYRCIENSIGVALSNTLGWEIMVPESSLNYYFDNGQRDNIYDFGGVRWTGSIDDVPGKIVVVFDYYEHSGIGVITADSYPDYSTINTFISPLTNNTIYLRDCLDFRPVRLNSIVNYMVFKEHILPNPQFLTEADITYYKPRYDRVYVTNNESNVNVKGQRFFVDKGTPNILPSYPVNKSNKNLQVIYNLQVPPYTSDVSLVNIEQVKLLNYTMSDIGFLENRIKTVENKVKRQGLEIIALNDKVFTPAGVELYKTGVFIDDFKTRNFGDIYNKEFKAAIDVIDESCYPYVIARSIGFKIENSTSVNINNNLVTMPIVGEEIFISQLDATGTTKANPAAIVVPPILILVPKTVEVPKTVIIDNNITVNVPNSWGSYSDLPLNAVSVIAPTVTVRGGGGSGGTTSTASDGKGWGYSDGSQSQSAAASGTVGGYGPGTPGFGGMGTGPGGGGGQSTGGSGSSGGNNGGGSGPGGGDCFLPDAKISMADGSVKNFEDIKVGDLVLGAFGEINPVLAIYYSKMGNVPMYKINNEHDCTDDEVFVTTNKEFYCINPEQGTTGNIAGWKDAYEMDLGNGITEMWKSPWSIGLVDLKLQKAGKGIELQTITGGRVLETFEPYYIPPETQLYNCAVGGSHTMMINGYAHTAWVRQDDFDYSTWKTINVELTAEDYRNPTIYQLK